MAKTLADMTPEERAECVGMWCGTAFGLAILAALRTNKDGDECGLFIRPKPTQWHTESFEHVTPRFDLPRAWTQDGAPLHATRETQVGDDGLYLDANGTTFPTTPGTTYHRWITDWEEVE